jgi:putative flavoprotein involved in K+ transport
MVQRSPTMVVNVEPAQLYDKSYLGDGPPIEVRDILNSGVPLPVMKTAHRLITDEVKQLDAPLLTRIYSRYIALQIAAIEAGELPKQAD